MIKSVGFIGSGNVASNLAPAIAELNIEVKYIFSKTKKHSEHLAKQLNCKSLDSLKDSPIVDAVFICVNDDTIVEIAKYFSNTKSIIVHCSGSVDRNVLDSCEVNGVFYPFQSFTKSEEAIWKNIPILIEANNFESELALNELAKKLSHTVEIVNSTERKALHLAGVLINNFTNHLAVLSNQFLHDNNLNPKLLESLSQQTFNRILEGKSESSQTGPAARHDEKTINKHLKMLSDNESLKKLYQHFTESIQSFKPENP